MHMADDYGIHTTIPAASNGPGFFGGLLDVLRNLKVAAGPKSVITSGQLPGMSYNDAFKPVREAKEQEDLIDMYMHIGENVVGMDMGPFKEARAKQKASGQPPSLGFAKAVQGIVQHGMQYGYRRPLGPSVAEAMFPEKITTTTPPTGGLPSVYQRESATGAPAPWQPPVNITDILGGENPWQPAPVTPGATTTTTRTLTPMQRLIKEEVARGRPSDVVRMLPTIAEHYPEALDGGGPTADVERTRIVDDLRRANPDMSPDLVGMFRSMPPQNFRGSKLPQTLRLARQYIHEDRQYRRMQNAPLRAEQDRYTNAIMQSTLPRDIQQKALEEIAQTTDERQPRQVYGRYVGQMPTQSAQETLRAAQASFNSTMNVYAPRMAPADVAQWRARAGQTRTADEVYALEQQMGQTIPAETPLTEDQKATRVQRLNTDIMGNLSKMTAYSGWLSGNATYEQSAPLITMPGGGSITIGGNIFGPTKQPRPLASTQGVKSFFAGAFATIERDIKELEKFDPALAAQHRANLQGLRDDLIAQQGPGTTPPPVLPQGKKALSPEAETSKTTFNEVLAARNLTEMPSEPVQRKEVLDAYYNLMAARGYDAKTLAAGMQRRFKGWLPPNP